MKIPQRKRIFFASEGVSERNYGTYLQRIVDSQNLPIHIDSQRMIIGGGDPLKIVKESVKLLTKNRKKRNKEEYKHRVVMLDKDTLGQNNNRDQQIQRIVTENDLQLIYNDPNFESLALHHLQNCQNLRPPANQTLAVLRANWPNYKKGMPATDLYKKLGIEGLKLATTVEPGLKEFAELIGIDLT